MGLSVKSKRIIKRLFPMRLIWFVLRMVTVLAIKLYSLKFRPLIIRKGTSDQEVFMSIFVLREFALPISIQPKLIIDAGAYTGLSTLYYATKYPGAKIIAVEAERSNFEVLEQHTSRLERVKRVYAGLWHRKGYLKIVDRGTGKWGFGVEEVEQGKDFDIKATDIATLLNDSGFAKIDILKLDVEGAEKFIFSHNSKQWIEKTNVMVIELHDRIIPGCTTALYSAIELNEWNEYRDGEKTVLIRKHLL